MLARRVRTRIDAVEVVAEEPEGSQGSEAAEAAEAVEAGERTAVSGCGLGVGSE